MGMASKLAAASQSQGQGQPPQAYGAPSYGQQPPQQGGPMYPGGAPQQYQQPPQGQYAAYPGPNNPQAAPQVNTAPGNAPSDKERMLFNILKECVTENGLGAFYDDARLWGTVGYLVKKAQNPVEQVCAKWGIPLEMGFDLTKLSLYDTVFLIDDSGSIAYSSLIGQLQDLLESAAYATSLFDDDGISVYFFNSDAVWHNIKHEDNVYPSAVSRLINQHKFAGETPLANSTQRKILQPILSKFGNGQNGTGQLRKPVHVIIITDGVPTDNTGNKFQGYVADANRIMNQRGRKVLSIQIAQVGNDSGAARFLQELDTDPVIGRMIDCTSNFEIESAQYRTKHNMQITRQHWYCKLLLGAIDKSYDEKDEGQTSAAPGQYQGQQGQYQQNPQNTYNQPNAPYPQQQQQQYGGYSQGGPQGYGGSPYPQQPQAPYPPQSPYPPQGYQYPPQQGQGQYPPQGHYQNAPPPGQGPPGYPPQGAYPPQGGYPPQQHPQGQQPQYNAQGQPAYGAPQQQGQYYTSSAPPATYNPGNQHKTNR